MFDGLIHDLTLATMADYDRLVSRLLLESEAKKSAEATEPAARPARHLHWWERGRNHSRAV